MTKAEFVKKSERLESELAKSRTKLQAAQRRIESMQRMAAALAPHWYGWGPQTLQACMSRYLTLKGPKAKARQKGRNRKDA